MLESVLAWLDDVGTTLLLTYQTVAWLVRPPFRVGQMLAAMEFIGVQSIFIVGLTGTFSGMVLALQTTYALRALTAEGRVVCIVATSLCSQAAPAFWVLMVTAGTGPAVAADL